MLATRSNPELAALVVPVQEEVEQSAQAVMREAFGGDETLARTVNGGKGGENDDGIEASSPLPLPSNLCGLRFLLSPKQALDELDTSKNRVISA
ncbi:MAG: hypothetical protein U9R77_14150 [Pseudomonadota bacterium]|nr:hypothetical protein [Pseudomonadota bacterium]